MSKFGQGSEAGEGYVNKLYTGVENFNVTHINPTWDELKTIYGDNAKEPSYTSVNDEGVKTLRLDFYLDNLAEDGEPQIKTRMSLFINKADRPTQDGSKMQVINVYGQTAWLKPDDKVTGDKYVLQGGKSGTYTFLAEGTRPAYQGEEALVSFMKNILNLSGPDKAKTKEDAYAQFSLEDWETMFSGNVSVLRSIITGAPNKIGLLLGVKTVEDGNVYQDVYTRQTLRQYAKSKNNFDYLRKDVVSAQENGSYPKTNFGNPDYKLREFTADEATPTNEAALSDPKPFNFSDAV
jgi:hypothetical protein